MYDEPSLTPDDTQPTQTIPLIDPDGEQPRGAGRLIGLMSLFGAVGFMLATVALLVMPEAAPPVNVVADQPTEAATAPVLPTAQLPPTDAPGLIEDDAPTPPPLSSLFVADALPTLDPQQAANLLLTPVSVLAAADPGQFARPAVNPFTIIPDRPRDTVIEYVVERGDTIYDIAQRFGLQQESIAWSNDRRLIWTLPVGARMRIPPTDGVIHRALGGATIAEIAARYRVADPLTIIDSPYNPSLNGLPVDYVPPSGMQIFVPGGQAESIDWTPPSIARQGGGGGGGAGDGLISFEPGAPGSCAAMEPGAATVWGSPMAPGTYTVTRTYSSWHQGIDLAASTGTPVRAANGGRVIFAGRSNWGYGLAVVISHGPFLTLYGHLSVVRVQCGNVVSTGQLIGDVGSTGNSSGPHLHFEIMNANGIRSNPASTIAF